MSGAEQETQRLAENQGETISNDDAGAGASASASLSSAPLSSKDPVAASSNISSESANTAGLTQTPLSVTDDTSSVVASKDGTSSESANAAGSQSTPPLSVIDDATSLSTVSNIIVNVIHVEYTQKEDGTIEALPDKSYFQQVINGTEGKNIPIDYGKNGFDLAQPHTAAITAEAEVRSETSGSGAEVSSTTSGAEVPVPKQDEQLQTDLSQQPTAPTGSISGGKLYHRRRHVSRNHRRKHKRATKRSWK